LEKVHKPPSNYHQIDNIPHKLPKHCQSSPNDETTIKKKILKLLEKTHKIKKKLKKSKGWKIKIKKTNPLYKKKMKNFHFFLIKIDFLFVL
jgi:hypothetical protein